MPKVLSAVLAVFILIAVCSCNNKASPGASLKAPAGDSSSGASSSEAPTAPAADSDRFYRARGTPHAGNYPSGYSAWASDGTLWVQDLNTIQVIGRDNALIKTVTLDQSKLPPAYILTWDVGGILAARAPTEDNRYEYGAVYQADGKIALCGVSLWDADGRLIKEYPAFSLNGDDSQAAITPAGVSIDWWHGLNDGVLIYWLDDHTIAINGHKRIILYDLDNDTGRVVDEMVALVEKHGKFGVYYGVDYNFCYVNDGNFYYLAHKSEEKANSSGTVWRVGREDAKASVLFEGREFTHLYMDRGAMALTEHIDSPEYGYNLWWADTRQGALNEMGFYKVHIPFVIDGTRIAMRSDESALYCYDMAQPKDRALTVVEPKEAVRDLFGTRLSLEGELQFVVSAADSGEDMPLSIYVLDAKSGVRRRICESDAYDRLSLSPDKSCGALFRSSQQNGLPQVCVRVLALGAPNV